MAKTDGCHNCVYGYFDGGLWLRTLFSGFPCGSMCANHPDTPGIMREVRCTICRNYRRKPPDPDAQAKTIVLTNGMIAYVDAADYEELSRYTWQLVSGGYAARIEKRRVIFMHRQIMNPPEGMVVDHIRGNRLDNTRAHLRVCTLAENAQNRAKPATATSRYRGVSYSKNREKWVVAIPGEGKQKYVGAFDDELEAARAYDYAAVLHLGDSARLNFPEEWPPERRAEVRAAYDAGKQRTQDGRPGTARQGKSPRTEGRGRKTAPKGKGGEADGRKSRRTTAPKGPRRRTHDAKRTTKRTPQKARKKPRAAKE